MDRAVMHHTRLESHAMALNLPKESHKPHQHAHEKTVTMLQDVLDLPASEVEETAVMNVPLNFTELVQSTPMTSHPPMFDFAYVVNKTYFHRKNEGNDASYLVSCC
jgi:hypothetical protein